MGNLGRMGAKKKKTEGSFKKEEKEGSTKERERKDDGRGD